MSRVLLCWEMGRNFGHLCRLSALAEGFRGRGHTVNIVAADEASAELFFSDVDIFSTPSQSVPKRRINQPCTYSHILFNCGFNDRHELTSRLSSWKRLLTTISPDLVVIDHGPTVALALRGLDVPHCMIGHGFECPPNKGVWPNLRRNSILDPKLHATIESEVFSCMNNALTATGGMPLDSVTDLFGAVSERFLLTYQELDPYERDDATNYWGVVDQSFGDEVQWPDGQGPRIFAYLRNGKSFVTQLTAINATSDRAIVFAPDCPDEIRGQFENKGLRLLSTPILIPDLMKECDVAMSYGGHGMVVQALLHAVPLVLMPNTLERDLTSQRVRKIGAGIRVPVEDQADANRIAESIHAALRTTVKNAVASFAKNYAGAVGPTERIVDRMERLIDRSK